MVFFFCGCKGIIFFHTEHLCGFFLKKKDENFSFPYFYFMFQFSVFHAANRTPHSFICSFTYDYCLGIVPPTVLNCSRIAR